MDFRDSTLVFCLDGEMYDKWVFVIRLLFSVLTVRCVLKGFCDSTLVLCFDGEMYDELVVVIRLLFSVLTVRYVLNGVV